MSLTVKKLGTACEKMEAERLIATSFLHEWDEKQARENAGDERGEAWAALDEQGRLMSAVTALRREMTYEGGVITVGEVHMVGTLPEARGSGAARALMRAVLTEWRERGDLFTVLIPFSFAFYRKYGFEAASEMLVQKAAIDQFASFRQSMTARQILSQADVDEARELYRRFALERSLADLKSPADWTYRGGGEFGERDWQYGGQTHYSYLFLDQDQRTRAYFTFVFVHGPEGPFTGTMAVTELVFDSPEALRSVFGFFYGMRAKVTHVTAELPRDADWSVLLPECDGVERRLDGHITARALNVEAVLSAMRHPGDAGQYSIRVTDDFIPENTGTYTVRFADGRAREIVRSGAPADMDMTVQTFCQLAVGRIALNGALYRGGSRLNGNRALLERVFTGRIMYLR